MSHIIDLDNPARQPFTLHQGNVRALLTLLIHRVVINEMTTAL